MGLGGVQGGSEDATHALIHGGNLLDRAAEAKGKKRTVLFNQAMEIFKRYEDSTDEAVKRESALLGHKIKLFEKSEESIGYVEKLKFSFQTLSKDPNVRNAMMFMRAGTVRWMPKI